MKAIIIMTTVNKYEAQEETEYNKGLKYHKI